ncbi:RING-H2 finger protein ATL1-like [Lycium barbarum]|uniref:RING-H2 finger protein ATL1-like n=1 Tax=Lycium barbarum TaxID=112863 RepID=UPI00293E9A20|nr:RING-H2 finger protein ATL1-like [Lycium barbarum]
MSSPDTSPGVGPSRWDPLLIVAVGVICLIFLLFSYFKIIQTHCCGFLSVHFYRNPRHQLNEQILEDPDSQVRSRGLDSYIMHSLPITQFKKNDEQTTRPTNADCVVCLGEFQDGEWLKHLPYCSHIFHVACIDTWFQIHSSCPLCRSNVVSVKMQQAHSITMNSLLETLRREDFYHERLVNNEDIRSQILHNHSSRAVEGSVD